MKRTTVNPKDTLLNITGTSIGRCSYVPDDIEIANVNQHVCILRFKDYIDYNFNRHYIAHQMGNEKFHSRNNALKLISLVDLMTYVLASCNGQHNRFMFDVNNNSYCTRLEYYQELANSSIYDKSRYNILDEHKNFKGYL